MLLNLHVKNMALIQDLEIDFSGGLNILTGETGAGKSILIGSINVALGTENFKNYAREDADTALVELVFSAGKSPVKERLQEMDIPLEDGQVILSRRLMKGRSISKVNGVTVPVSQIRELASMLIDIHGQHEHQSLLYKKNHLRILDEFAGEELAPLLEKGQGLYEVYVQYRKKLEESSLDESTRKKEMDFLEYEIEEIQGASLKEGEDEELESAYRKLANARKIGSAAGEVYGLTSENTGSAADTISAALQRLFGVSGYDRELENISAQLGEIESLVSDFNRELSRYLDSLSFDDNEFVQVEERLDTINHLKTKYGNSISDILSYKEEKEKRLLELQDYDAYLGELEKNYKKAENELRENAKAISEIRSRHGAALSAKIREELQDLNFLETNFEISLEQTGPLSANGFDEACFLISMNPGAPLRPLGDVASGGELSRIMLAIKTVLADKDQTESLIFDEIDVGISGRTAQKVSEKMAVIAASRQVLCITHLAQIASMADHHYFIEKAVKNHQTVTTIQELDREESIGELARILGGARITDTTRENAREMKEMAESTKKY